MSPSPLADQTNVEDPPSSSRSDPTAVTEVSRNQLPLWWGSGEYPPIVKPILNKVFAYCAAVSSKPKQDLAARRRRVALSVIEAYNDWDIEKIMEPRAPECTHQLLPASLNYSELTYQAYKVFFSSIMPYFRNLKATVQDVFDDGTENKVVLCCLAHAETAIGPYDNEYIFMIYLDKDCNKAVKILEYVDSAYALEFFPKLRAYMSENRGQDWASLSAESDKTSPEART